MVTSIVDGPRSVNPDLERKRDKEEGGILPGASHTEIKQAEATQERFLTAVTEVEMAPSLDRLDLERRFEASSQILWIQSGETTGPPPAHTGPPPAPTTGPPSDHRWTTAGPPSDHRRTTVEPPSVHHLHSSAHWTTDAPPPDHHRIIVSRWGNQHKRFWYTPLEKSRSADSENIFSEFFDHRKASKIVGQSYCSGDTVDHRKNQFAGEDDTVAQETRRRRRHCRSTVATM
ncbi:hypothetical protein LXL04_018635 [Taraxacum kok-saghyz]